MFKSNPLIPPILVTTKTIAMLITVTETRRLRFETSVFSFIRDDLSVLIIKPVETVVIIMDNTIIKLFIYDPLVIWLLFLNNKGMAVTIEVMALVANKERKTIHFRIRLKGFVITKTRATVSVNVIRADS